MLKGNPVLSICGKIRSSPRCCNPVFTLMNRHYRHSTYGDGKATSPGKPEDLPQLMKQTHSGEVQSL